MNTKLFNFCCKRRDLLCNCSNGDIFTYEDNMLFSCVKISCFRAKAHLSGAKVVRRSFLMDVFFLPCGAGKLIFIPPSRFFLIGSETPPPPPLVFEYCFILCLRNFGFWLKFPMTFLGWVWIFSGTTQTIHSSVCSSCLNLPVITEHEHHIYWVYKFFWKNAYLYELTTRCTCIYLANYVIKNYYNNCV